MKKINYYFAITVALFILNINQIWATDYVINGNTELQAFVNGAGATKEVVGNLTIKGTDITSITGVAARVSEITSSVTLDNLSITTNVGFFDAIKCAGGSIYIRNCPLWTSSNGFRLANGINSTNGGYTHIGGDFVIENCPMVANPGNGGWVSGVDCFSNIETVGGSYRIIGINADKCVTINTNTYLKLKSVGGDFELTNILKLAGVNNFPVQSIGGNLIIQNNPAFKNLLGLQNTLLIGGNVTIYNNPLVVTSSSLVYGYCFLRYMKDEGIITGTVKAGTDANPVDISTITSCPSGIVAGVNDIKAEKFVSISPTIITEGSLKIDAKVNIDKVEIFDFTGKNILKLSDIPTGKTSIDISKLTKGIYMIKLSTSNNGFEVYRIIKS